MKEVVGQIRKSQIISMFGVGSLVDLPHLSVVVRGLNSWQTAACSEIVEPRLLAVVRTKVSAASKIRMCPDVRSDEAQLKKVDPNGVPVSVYPRWLRCPLCNQLGTVDSGVFKIEFPPFQVDKIRFIHRGCPRAGNTPDSRMAGALPARFLIACSKGHVSDFPWIAFCHRSRPCAKGSPSLVLTDEGVTGEAADVQVRCLGCAAWRPLADAFGQNADPGVALCSGEHPHLATKEPCEEPVKTVLLGASNLYFPVTVSVLALPEKTILTDLDIVVKQHWERCEQVASEAEAAMLLKFGAIPEFVGHNASDLWAAIQRAKEGVKETKLADLRAEEYRLLAEATKPIKSERMSVLLHSGLTGFLGDYFERIALVDHLMEFIALVGFTRIESVGDLSDYDTIDAARLAPLMPPPVTWVPGTENRGEGIFLRLHEDRLSEWEGRPAVKRRMTEHAAAMSAYRKERPWMQIELPPARYFLMHTLSHMLIRELAIACGYASTSLRERIYSAPSGAETGAMAGILLYTASSDSEGTLGGLVALGKPNRFESILRSALERARVCSSDPICAYREIAKGSRLHGASCHSCSFVAETSCERSNRFLDRAFLVETLATPDCRLFVDYGTASP